MMVLPFHWHVPGAMEHYESTLKCLISWHVLTYKLLLRWKQLDHFFAWG